MSFGARALIEKLSDNQMSSLLLSIIPLGWFVKVPIVLHCEQRMTITSHSYQE